MQGRGVVVGLVLSLAIGMGAWARTPVRSAAELDQLLGPIALYPDPVLAQILPAATAPDDLALAVKFLEDGGNLGDVDAQPWNDNAKALARYPEALRMMNRSREWTDAVGTAFLDQPKELMKSIQRLRAVALASGALQTSNEQRVAAEGGIVYVYPADPTSIYLPQYDADRVFALRASSGGYGMVTFGSAMLVGYWLHHELDWRKHRIYSYNYREYPYGRRNPWYFGGEGTGQAPPNLPEQDNGKWKADKKKRRPQISPGEPLPTVQNVVVPAKVIQENGEPKPITESRPLAAPKDLPPPPPMLTPVDPEMEPVEEPPAVQPAQVKPGGQKAVADKPVPAKAVKAKPAEAKPVPAKTGKAKSVKEQPVPTKPRGGKAAETKPSSAKAGKEKPAPAAAGKAKSTEKKSVPAKSVRTESKEKKLVPANTDKAKSAGVKPSTKKQR